MGKQRVDLCERAVFRDREPGEESNLRRGGMRSLIDVGCPRNWGGLGVIRCETNLCDGEVE